MLELAALRGGIQLIGLTAVLLIINFANLKIEPASMSLAILSVALMATPVYYLSVPLIVVAAIMGGIKSISSLSTTFVFTLLPLLEIDNALYYARIGTPNAPPILFAQLSDFAGAIRPPLASLNFALAGLPSGLLYPGANQVAQYLVSGAPTLLTPIVVFSLIFGFSSSVAGLLITFLGKFTAFERTQRVLKTLSPLFTAVVTPTVFIMLLAFLSPTNLGGYVTGLTQGWTVALWVILSSVVFGAFFTGREYLLGILERREFARDELVTLTSQARESIVGLLSTLDSVALRVPSIDLAGEKMTIKEYLSYMDDVQKGLETANYDTLSGWLKELQEKIVPATTKNIPETLRIKVTTEVNMLVSLAATYNASLEEAKSGKLFPELHAITGEAEIEQAVQAYLKTTWSISEAGKDLFAQFVSVSNACNSLQGKDQTEPPLNPASLFASNDYPTGMKLLAEEYWLNFHIGREEEFESKIRNLRGLLLQLGEKLDPADKARLNAVGEAISDAPPAKSPLVLEKMKELVSLLGGVVGGMKAEVEGLESMIKGLSPAALKVGNFEAPSGLGTISRLEGAVAHTSPSFDEVSAFVESFIPVLNSLREAQRRDEAKLIVIAHYQTARHELDLLLADKRVVSLDEVPFQREAASTFAKIYALSSRTAKYDEINEQIMIRNA